MQDPFFKTQGSDVFLCLKGKPQEDAPEALISSSSDAGNHLSRMMSKVLSCKNQPAELNPTAMAQQLEEAQVRFKITCCMTYLTNNKNSFMAFIVL